MTIRDFNTIFAEKQGMGLFCAGNFYMQADWRGQDCKVWDVVPKGTPFGTQDAGAAGDTWLHICP